MITFCDDTVFYDINFEPFDIGDVILVNRRPTKIHSEEQLVDLVQEDAVFEVIKGGEYGIPSAD